MDYDQWQKDHAAKTGYVRRLMLAKEALLSTGYFTEEQLKGLDVAPRIIELWSAFGWCFCKDVALIHGAPMEIHGVEHTRDGCSYTDTPRET